MFAPGVCAALACQTCRGPGSIIPVFPAIPGQLPLHSPLPATLSGAPHWTVLELDHWTWSCRTVDSAKFLLSNLPTSRPFLSSLCPSSLSAGDRPSPGSVPLRRVITLFDPRYCFLPGYTSCSTPLASSTYLTSTHRQQRRHSL